VNQSPKSSKKWVECGCFKRPWGIKGQILVFWNSGICPVKVNGGEVYIHEPERGYIPLIILNQRINDKKNVLSIKGIDTPEQVSFLINKKIYITEDNLGDLQADEYYCYQILGLKVKTVSDEYIGTVVKIFSTGSNDIYEVAKEDGKTVLIPAIKSVIKKVDVKAGILIIEPIEGMEL